MKFEDFPHNLEYEQMIIGAILIRPESIGQIKDFLLPEDFYSPRHQDIFRVLLNQEYNMSLASICEELKRQGKLDSCGGSDYLAKIGMECLTSAGIEVWSASVKNLSLERQIITTCMNAQHKIITITPPQPIFFFMKHLLLK